MTDHLGRGGVKQSMLWRLEVVMLMMASGLRFLDLRRLTPRRSGRGITG
jgi:hypothetical protein